MGTDAAEPLLSLLRAFRALGSSPSEEDLAAAVDAASTTARVLAVAAEPDPAALAALQLLTGRLQTLAGDDLAALSVDTAVQLAENLSNGNDHEHLLVEALLCAASSHRAAGRPDIARLRAGRALAIAQVRLAPNDPAIAQSWTQLGRACEQLHDLTAAHAAYQQADAARRTGRQEAIGEVNSVRGT